MMAYGFVYVAMNEAMPGLYKIGHTTKSPMQRCAELSANTSVPSPFELVYAAETANAPNQEQAVHLRMGEHRNDASREFFKLNYFELTSLGEHLRENVADHPCNFYSGFGLILIDECRHHPVLEASNA
jgi:hypothetical protein